MKTTKNKQILIAGATGLIGRALTKSLINEGYNVMVLTRFPKVVDNEFPEKVNYIEWNGIFTTWLVREVEKSIAVINLAGEGIANKRWGRKRKLKLIKSRLSSARALAKACNYAKKKPEVFIQASAIGYYPFSLTEVFNEDSPSGNSFLSNLSVDWEAVASHDIPKEIRLVIIRTGIVLSKHGGFLPKLVYPIKFLVGGWFGNGQQVMSWIHIQDEVNAILFLMENSNAKGPFNLVAPNPISQKELVQKIARRLKRPACFAIPNHITKAIYGQMGKELMLSSQNVEPKKLINSGFSFSFPTIDSAIESLL
jgi:hypothetical protein